MCNRGVLIHSLAQTIHYLTTEDEVQRSTFESAERPPRWYWGLIQVNNGEHCGQLYTKMTCLS
jgi:hypothetical protein